MRRAALLTVLLIVTVPLVRAATVLGLRWAPLDMVAPFLVYSDWLAAGALLTLSGPQLARSGRYRALRSSGWWTLFLVASALTAWTALGHWRIRELTAGWTAIAVALLVDQLTSEPGTLAARALAVRPMVWIGRVSYSLYLWQELFCNRNSTMWWARFPLNVVLSFVFAAISYYWVERPVLAWRDRHRRV